MGIHGRLALAAAGLAGLAWCVAARPADDPAGRSATETAALVAPRVEALRGLSFTRDVPVAVVDEDTAVEHLLRRVEQFQPKELLERTLQVYEKLGLLPPGFDVLGSVAEWARADVAGFYDPESGSLFVVEHVPEDTATLVIAHELTHALEDQHFDLDARMREVIDDDDRQLAQAAVREGSATLLMGAFAAERGEPGLDTAVDLAAGDSLAPLPAVLRRELLAPYVLGPAFLRRGEGAGTDASAYPIEDANRAWADPPQSTEQILHPEKYWNEASRDDPRAVDFAGAGEAMGRRWKRTMHGTLGELTLGVLVSAPSPGDAPPAGPDGDWSNAASRGWDGDRWELWVRGDSAVVLLGTLWDSPADAAEFAAALPSGAGLRWLVQGDSVALIAGHAGARADRVLRRMIEGLTVAPGAALVPGR